MSDAATVEELASAVDPAALARHLADMPGPRRRPQDASAIAATVDHLRSSFRDAGWEVREQPCDDPHLGPGANVIARLAGSDDRALVAVVAHHDTVSDSPGADDNGSGLVALIELARLLPRRRWHATIELAAVDFEESNDPAGRATFAGSRAYVSGLVRDGAELRGAVVYDLIAYADPTPGSQRVPPGASQLFPQVEAMLEQVGRRGDFLVAIGGGTPAGSAVLGSVLRAAERVAPALRVVPFAVPAGSPMQGDFFRSDHVAFWEAGLPAVMLTDTADFRNPHYHRPTDRPETLDPVFWSRVVAATIGTIALLAEP